MADQKRLIELLKEAASKAYEAVESRQLAHPFEVWDIVVDHLIANGVTVQKWIPVTERLPEPMVCVLCWYEYFRFGSYYRMFQTYGIGHYFRDGMWGGEVSNGQKARVLAWIPLPEPPKGE